MRVVMTEENARTASSRHPHREDDVGTVSCADAIMIVNPITHVWLELRGHGSPVLEKSRKGSSCGPPSPLLRRLLPPVETAELWAHDRRSNGVILRRGDMQQGAVNAVEGNPQQRETQ